MIAKTRCGVVIYEEQEGRGIGLIPKLLAYEQQDLGADTVEANERLGLKNDYRDFSFPVEILRSLGISQVGLLTNNPEKFSPLAFGGIEVVARIPCEVDVSPYADQYLRIKKEKLGHLLKIHAAGSPKSLESRSSRGPQPHEGPLIPTKNLSSDVESALAEIRAGRIVIVVDHEVRENEGDLTMAAEKLLRRPSTLWLSTTGASFVLA